MRNRRTLCETALGRDSGLYVGLIDEKTEGRTSRATVPFIVLLQKLFVNQLHNFEKRVGMKSRVIM
jgi:hypothetical protein